ncbi:Protein phosphatase 1F [Balamuthia mandrillaris]
MNRSLTTTTTKKKKKEPPTRVTRKESFGGSVVIIRDSESEEEEEEKERAANRLPRGAENSSDEDENRKIEKILKMQKKKYVEEVEAARRRRRMERRKRREAERKQAAMKEEETQQQEGEPKQRRSPSPLREERQHRQHRRRRRKGEKGGDEEEKENRNAEQVVKSEEKTTTTTQKQEEEEEEGEWIIKEEEQEGGGAGGGGEAEEKDTSSEEDLLELSSEPSDLPPENEEEDESGHEEAGQELNQLEESMLILRKAITDEKQLTSMLNSLVLFIKRYPRIRIAHPKLTPEGVALLRAVGFEEENGYLITTPRNRDLIKKNGDWVADELAKLQGTYVPVKKPIIRRATSDDLLRDSVRYPTGHADTKGRREYMEDRAVLLGGFVKGRQSEDYFAVFDGHGGADAAEFAALNLHRNLEAQLTKLKDPVKSLKAAFVETHKQIINENVQGGTTALVCFCQGDRMYIANAGDSRAVLHSNKHKALRITVDHKPNNPIEKKRIKERGGKVTHAWWFSKCYRVNGILAVARALGDAFIHEVITSEPDVFDVSEHITGTNGFIILACDGLWDVCSDAKAVKIASASEDPRKASRLLMNYAYRKGSTDNITVIVIRFWRK